MIGEVGIATVITNLIHQHRVNLWCKLIISVSASGICTFFGTLGTAGLAHLSTGMSPKLALAYAFFESCLTTAAITFWMWNKNPLSKGLPIAVPSSIEIKQNEILVNEGISSNERKK